ncbi:MAG: DegT/DnrJ/EryC1/StrS aminotransferase family protein [Planctomycetota bacterium]|nr:DegT/DnrJ/EryC1/StrS aminotransferase family protein [Planctomycetota bacterium]
MPTAATTATLAIDGGQPVSPTMVPFMKPQLHQQDIDAAHAVLESGMLRAATRCAELEERFATISDARHSLTCSNGTAALQLAYAALFSPGDEILVPAWTFIATATMIVAAGCTPVFVDCLEDTFQMDPEDAAKKITPKTRGIAATHLYGCPVDINAFQALATKHDLKVVYDAAQAHLARYDGKGLGAFGDVVTYSFYATKNLGTGEGGLVTTNDDAIARDIALLRSHGETEKYLHERIGFNYRMNDITGAIGCSRLDRLPQETAARQAAAKRFDAILAEIEGLDAPTITATAEPAWHLYTVKFDPTQFTCTRDRFIDTLKAEGVPTAVHYPRATSDQPALAQWNKNDTPVSSGLTSRVFSLPMHHALTDEHFDTIAKAMSKVAGAYRG